MKIRLYDYWLSTQDLLMGRRAFVDMLTFLLGLMNFIIGVVVIWTVPLYSNWTLHLCICGVLILLGFLSMLTAIIPLKNIQRYVDICGAFLITYGFFMLSRAIGYRQVAYAFMALYALLYIWMWILQGVNHGIGKNIK